MRPSQPINGLDEESASDQDRVDESGKGVEDELPDEAADDIRDRPWKDGNDPKEMPFFNLRVEEKGYTEAD